ncbi:hypothetical protein KEM44_29935 [Sinorhizobium meliloti]|nr:hypothetical protein [Sinorhizobium meliloti]MCK3781777.1 hypothetical protein [Sinorhizobium meliloti]MCK3789596.1 hypothetical protein [Sinorhizobium meliloti]MCK3796507.1 hypothetical protein [Sinorhizobium meliloti]MDW9645879.1 hypothetical protein [Sinorhizobium meliloti]UTG97468.1 hypothetical protein KEM44_29935 [Sinorhizobium meliloti]
MAGIEGALATFQQILNEILALRHVDRSAQLFRDDGSLDAALDDWPEAYNLFGVAQDRNVRVVAGEYELSAAVLDPHGGNDAVGDKSVVEIVFGLVDDERGIGFQQEKQKDRRSLLAGRELHSLTHDYAITTDAYRLKSFLSRIRIHSNAIDCGMNVIWIDCCGPSERGQRFYQSLT